MTGLPTPQPCLRGIDYNYNTHQILLMCLSIFITHTYQCLHWRQNSLATLQLSEEAVRGQNSSGSKILGAKQPSPKRWRQKVPDPQNRVRKKEFMRLGCITNTFWQSWQFCLRCLRLSAGFAKTMLVEMPERVFLHVHRDVILLHFPETGLTAA